MTVIVTPIPKAEPVGTEALTVPPVYEVVGHRCVLAIVGSVAFRPGDARCTDAERVEAVALIVDAIQRHAPRRFISGGADGIDSMAETEARRELGGRNVRVYRPGVRRFWGAGGFRERDEWMADDCEHLVRIFHAKSTTYGSGWTADEAEKQGKLVERFMVGTK